jgi:hypothetical protein
MYHVRLFFSVCKGENESTEKDEHICYTKIDCIRENMSTYVMRNQEDHKGVTASGRRPKLTFHMVHSGEYLEYGMVQLCENWIEGML